MVLNRIDILPFIWNLSMSIFSRSNSLSQYLMKTQTSSRDQHLGSCPRPPGSWVLSWSESRGEGERGLPAPVPPPRGLKGLGYRHKNSGEKGSGGWGGGAPVPLSEIGGTFMPVKVKVKLVRQLCKIALSLLRLILYSYQGAKSIRCSSSGV